MFENVDWRKLQECKFEKEPDLATISCQACKCRYTTEINENHGYLEYCIPCPDCGTFQDDQKL